MRKMDFHNIFKVELPTIFDKVKNKDDFGHPCFFVSFNYSNSMNILYSILYRLAGDLITLSNLMKLYGF